MNSKTMFARCVALTFVTLSSAICHAAVISVQPVIAGYFNPTTYDPIPPIPAGVNPGFTVVVQVDVMMEVISLGPGEDAFGSAAFSFDLSSPGGLSQIEEVQGIGWSQNDIPIDTNGSAPGGQLPIFLPVLPPQDDLEDILVISAASNQPNDPRRDLGEAGSSLGVPYLLGTGFVEWDGLSEAQIKLDELSVSAKRLDGSFVPGQATPSNVLVLGLLIPEPSSVVILGGMLMVAGLRWRNA